MNIVKKKVNVSVNTETCLGTWDSNAYDRDMESIKYTCTKLMNMLFHFKHFRMGEKFLNRTRNGGQF